MRKIVDNKNRQEIADEWDKIVELRRECIDSGLDKSFIYITSPRIIKGLHKYDPNKEAKVLDCGCGDGHLTNIISNYCHNVTGVDMSYRSILLAQNDYPKISFVLDSIENYARTSEQYDICVANMVLSNVENINDITEAVFRILNNNGILLMTIPHPCFWSEYCGYDREEWFNYNKQQCITGDFSITGAGVLGKSTYYSRPLEVYLNTFIQKGFQLNRFEELYSDVNLGMGDFKKPRFVYMEFQRK